MRRHRCGLRRGAEVLLGGLCVRPLDLFGLLLHRRYPVHWRREPEYQSVRCRWDDLSVVHGRRATMRHERREPQPGALCLRRRCRQLPQRVL